MSPKLSFSLDDDAEKLVKRYEQYLQGNAAGYFDVEEIELIFEFYLQKGKTSKCQQLVDFGLRLHPASALLKTKRAKMYLAIGETTKAYHILTTQNIDASDYETGLLKVEALLRLNKDNEAQQLAYTILASEKSDLDNIALDLAYIFISQIEFNTAVKLLEKGMKYNSKNSDLLIELAFCYEQIELNDKACETYEKVLAVDPYRSEAWFNLGQIYFGQSFFHKAIEAYDYALTINPDDVMCALQKAHAYFQVEEYKLAIEAYEDYNAILPEAQWQTNIFVGECYEKLENFSKALECYKASLLIQEDNYDALTGIAICLLEMELYDESIGYSQKAIAINPEAADALVYLAEGYTGIDDLENALKSYLKSISLEPNQPDTLMAIANILMEMESYKHALQYYKMAYDQDGGLERIHLFLAVAYWKNEFFDQSVEHLKMARAENLDAIQLFIELCPDALLSNNNDVLFND